MKREVAKALQDTDRPIVVILDDLDRLDPDETRQIFRMVKAVADFDRVSYLLAYDPGPVHRALSFDGNYDGPVYLEKIVQVAYPLPQPGYWALKKYLTSRLEGLLKLENIKDFEDRQFQELLVRGGLAQAIKNPRDVNRLVNRVQISLPATRGEVNAADLIGFEALALKFPNIAQAVRKRPYEFVGGWIHHDEPLISDHFDRMQERSSTNKPKDVPPWLSGLWKDLPPEEKRPLLALLDSLFPGLTGNRLFDGHGSVRQMEAELRICRPKPLRKLLAVGRVQGTPSASQVRRFLSNASGRRDILQEVCDSGEADEWLAFAGNFLVDALVEDPISLIDCLLDELEERSAADRVDAQALVRSMMYFVLDMLKSLPAEEAVGSYKFIATNERSLSISHDVVLAVAQDHGLWPTRSRRALDHEIILQDSEAAEEGVPPQQNLWVKFGSGSPPSAW